MRIQSQPSCVVRACLCKPQMDERKRVLVQFGDNYRCIVVPTTSETTQLEKKLLEEKIRNVFSDLLAPCDKIYFQVKWGGIFVDVFENDVVHKCFQDGGDKTCPGMYFCHEYILPICNYELIAMIRCTCFNGCQQFNPGCIKQC